MRGSRKFASLGLDEIVVSDAGDEILILFKRRSQKLKRVLERYVRGDCTAKQDLAGLDLRECEIDHVAIPKTAQL